MRRRAVIQPVGARWPVLVAGAALCLALAGCGSDGGPGPGAATTKVPATGSGNTVTADDSANGTTVELRTGQRLVVTLHSTYWQLEPPTDTAVLGEVGGPVPQTDPSCGTIPGTGCGKVTATFVASAGGTSDLVAHRDSCGEALRCTGGRGDWKIAVHVSG